MSRAGNTSAPSCLPDGKWVVMRITECVACAWHLASPDAASECGWAAALLPGQAAPSELKQRDLLLGDHVPLGVLHVLGDGRVRLQHVQQLLRVRHLLQGHIPVLGLPALL